VTARGGPSRAPPSRDIDATPFTPILTELLTRIPGAYASVLVDYDGETVDYAGMGDPFDLKVAAAHLRILLNDVEALGALGDPRWLVIRGARRSIVARALPERYALVVLLRRRAGFTASRRAFDACEQALCEEAGLARASDGPRWYPVEVEADRRGRPRRVGSAPVEVLGAVVGLAARERGFRVRIADGRELTVVREARSCWYADERLDDRAIPAHPAAPAQPARRAETPKKPA
jgi:predicted regulator of Ras-like GTPase activity (Roadblock/LC7/MglB family)